MPDDARLRVGVRPRGSDIAFVYEREGVEFRVNTTTTGEQSTPSIAALPDGGYIIT